jgi:hypothetical protein
MASRNRLSCKAAAGVGSGSDLHLGANLKGRLLSGPVRRLLVELSDEEIGDGHMRVKTPKQLRK